MAVNSFMKSYALFIFEVFEVTKTVFMQICHGSKKDIYTKLAVQELPANMSTVNHMKKIQPRYLLFCKILYERSDQSD